MKFGEAIEAMKLGGRCRRRGWNGQGMAVSIEKGELDAAARGFRPGEWIQYPHGSLQDGVDFGLFRPEMVGPAVTMPFFFMRTASGATVTGWLASQIDMLAEDWEMV